MQALCAARRTALDYKCGVHARDVLEAFHHLNAERVRHASIDDGVVLQVNVADAKRSLEPDLLRVDVNPTKPLSNVAGEHAVERLRDDSTSSAARVVKAVVP